MYFSIKNITTTLNKRHPKFSSTLDLKYNLEVGKGTIKLLPNQEVTIEANLLPIGIHKARIEGLVLVKEMTRSEYYKTRKDVIVTGKLEQPKPEQPKPKKTSKRTTTTTTEPVETEE
jgi:hypothetical protein